MKDEYIPGELFCDIRFERFFDVLNATINALCENGHLYIDDGIGILDENEIKEILLKGAKYYREYCKKEFKKFDDTI